MVKKRLFIISIIAIFIVSIIAGCNGEAHLPPNVETEVYMAEAFVSEMNERCQAGDPNACSNGLVRSAEILTLIVDALEGKGSE